MRHLSIRLATAILCLGIMRTGAEAQEQWQWPEQPKNLTELKGLTGEQLRPVMLGFTRALGVGCSHCHVGVPGKPLTTYDFVSDENPNKNRARAMYRMVASINEQLKAIEPSGPKRVNMWCHTCHRGRPRPMTLAEELGEVYGRSGPDETIAHYRKLKGDFHSRGAYDFGESALTCPWPILRSDANRPNSYRHCARAEISCGRVDEPGRGACGAISARRQQIADLGTRLRPHRRTCGRCPSRAS